MYVFLYFMHIFCIFSYFSIGFYHKKQHKVSFRRKLIYRMAVFKTKDKRDVSKQNITLTI